VAVTVAVTIAIRLAREPGASPRPARLRAGVDDRCPATGPAARLAERIPPECWLRISAGWDAKGRRWYAWSRVALATACASDGWGRWLLARRSLTTGELAHYVCAGPASTPLVALVRVAGTRWRVEEAFQAGNGLCGLDEHQVRRWRSWYRWVTLAMLVYAFLVVAAVTEHARHPPPLGLLPLTCNEIQHLQGAGASSQPNRTSGAFRENAGALAETDRSHRRRCGATGRRPSCPPTGTCDEHAWMLANGATPDEENVLRTTAPRLLGVIQDRVWEPRFAGSWPRCTSRSDLTLQTCGCHARRVRSGPGWGRAGSKERKVHSNS
jgi:hypothetical protein